MLVNVRGFVNVLCAGLSAGEVFVIRYGVRAPVASLNEKPRLQLRQALIRTESPNAGERKRFEAM